MRVPVMTVDAIGWRVPAVPTATGLGFWGHGRVPDEGLVWWLHLPTRAAENSRGNYVGLDHLSRLA